MLRRKPTRIELRHVVVVVVVLARTLCEPRGLSDASLGRQEDKDEVEEMRKAAKAQNSTAGKPLEHLKEKEGSTRSRIGL